MSNAEIIAELRKENAYLKQELNTLKRLIFASKSERYKSTVDVHQIDMFAGAGQQQDLHVQEEKQTITYQRKKKAHPGRNKLPEHLPVEEVIIEPEQDVTGLKKIGEEVSETLKYTKASLVKVRTIRPKYERPDQEGVLIAPLPSRALHKCIAEPSLVAHILVSKFVDHLPYYRQIKRFKRDFDWELSSSTINDWFVSCCTLLKPIYAEMAKKIRQSHYIQVDESPLKVLESEKAKQCHQGYQWVYHSPIDNIVVFQYRKGRGTQGPREFLKEYKGYLQCDGYKVYDKIGKSKSIQLVGCMAHARRYFHQALDNDKSKSEYAMDKFKAMYTIERSWKNKEITQEQRQHKIRSLLEELKEWCGQQSYKFLPRESIGKAIQYFINQYPKLYRVTDTEDIQIDNNLIENTIRPLALGRKNYLFAGNHKAAQRIAMMYSFFATCKAKGKDPSAWLESTLIELANPDCSIEELIP